MRYTVIRSRRKTAAIQVKGAGEVIVRAPQEMPRSAIDAFVAGHEGWIMRQLARREEQAVRPPLDDAELRALAERAREVIPERAARYAPMLGVTYGRITIRHQKTRWGSCSAKGNLNFNCLLMRCPREALDYVVVHELCHRREMNHSPRFWALVESILPDYRRWRGWLRKEGRALIG